MQRDANSRTDAPPSEVLDALALDRLEFVARAGDPTLIARLVGLFLEDTPDRLHHLRAATERRDDAALRAVAHALRGSSETFGARDMANQCRALELMPPEWDDAAVNAHLEALVAAFERTRIALETLVREQPQ
ncbi:MAG: Hpt domain-containing protein [Chloroflexi bacterium]|nr:Hpt domain-containing protein [Chloroflexota bacterium]